jgi:subtilisin family serine protease
VWRSQALSQRLDLAEVHPVTRGAGSTVAVLDTGADFGHPALAGRLRAGYDYVDEDNDPSDSSGGLDTHANGVADEAYGHGTFVAGTVSLVAPDATVLVQRVLDSDGSGSVFVLAEAIVDAVDLGANVINLSMGTADHGEPRVIQDALWYARQFGTVVVAAAGNAGNDRPQYPARDKHVLSVTSLTESDRLATFACWGDWVDLATPSDRVAGPVPGGLYAWWAGTSMAAPQVSGQAALVHALRPRLMQDKSTEALTKSARKLIHKIKIKYGAIDIAASVRMVQNEKGKGTRRG